MTPTPSPPPAAATDDHAFAAWAATTAGDLLTEVRGQGLTGPDLKDAGDLAAHDLLMALCAEHRPGDAVMSEESKASIADRDRLDADRVWIIDPLDGTREFSEPPRDDWAVHVALWARTPGESGSGGAAGELVAGAVAQPGLGRTFHTGEPTPVPERTSQRPRIAVSRTRAPALVERLAAELGADLVPMGSAGAKVISVVRDVADAYVHAGGMYEWDSAAPVAVARAAGLHTSRIDGSPLVYNREEVWLPDLVVCRPELADAILDLVRRVGVE